jgi:prolipoprotein diacylglyceryltransferase
MAYVIAAVSGLLGARGLYVAQHPDTYTGVMSLLRLPAGELALGGGMIAGALATAMYVRRLSVPIWAWLDCLAPSLLLVIAIERFGAFLAGADFGIYAPGFPLAVVYPAESAPAAYHRWAMEGLSAGGDSLPVHPVQLYACVGALAGVGGARWIRTRRRVFSGQIALLCVGWYALIRMVVDEQLRALSPKTRFGPFDLDLVAGVGMVGVVLLAYATRAAAARREPQRARAWEGGPWSPHATPDEAKRSR